MKKIFTLIALALVSFTLSAKEVSTNSSTGMVLDETAGVYSLKGKAGIIILGDLTQARDFLYAADKCFIQEKLKNTFDVGEQKYTVGSDEDGLYIIRIGLGGVKVRPSDASQFLVWVESRIIKDKAIKVKKVLMEK